MLRLRYCGPDPIACTGLANVELHIGLLSSRRLPVHLLLVGLDMELHVGLLSAHLLPVCMYR